MISINETVCDNRGKFKTLESTIKDICAITPETPVYTSNDSMELKDYIESLITTLIAEVE